MTNPESPVDAVRHGRAEARSRMLGYHVFSVTRALADLLAVLAAFAASYLLYSWLLDMGLGNPAAALSSRYELVGLAFGGILLATYWHLGLYKQRASVLNLWEVATALKGLAVAGAFFFAVLFFLNLTGHSRLVIVGGMAIAAVLIFLERRLISAALRGLQIRGRLGRRVLIYGCGEAGQLLMKKIVQVPHAGCTVMGFLDEAVPPGSLVTCRLNQTKQQEFQAPVLGDLNDLSELAGRLQIDELLVASPSLDTERSQAIIERCHKLGLTVGIVPQLGDVRIDQVEVDDLSAIPVLRPHSEAAGALHFAAKRAFDIVVASLLLVISAPLSLAAAIAIRLESPGPVIFSQDRIGQAGQRFRMFKFRTMRVDVDPYAPAPATRDDSRITRVGRLLRLGGIDELPQLINVLRGEMSLVGPRPEMPFIVAGYTALERIRLTVKPGITGLWQLSADRHAEIHENLEYDLYYIRHHSLLLDALILLETTFFAAGAILHSLRAVPNGGNGKVLTTRVASDADRLGTSKASLSSDKPLEAPSPAKTISRINSALVEVPGETLAQTIETTITHTGQNHLTQGEQT